MAGTMFWSFLSSILILVTIREFGHYWVARRCGVAIEKFSIGFGPAILTWKNKEGTEFVLAAIPLGGYVKMRGEYTIATNEQQSRQVEGSFAACSVWQRMAIVAAGPLVNLIFAVVLIAGLTFGEKQGVAPTVMTPATQTLATHLGLQNGDVIESVNGTEVKAWEQIEAQLRYAVFDRHSIDLVWRSADGIRRQGQIPTVDLDIEKNTWFDTIGLAPPKTIPRIGRVLGDGVAEQAGLKVGDEVVQVDDQLKPSRQMLIEHISQSAGKNISLLVHRAGQIIRVNLVPQAKSDFVKTDSEVSEKMVGKIGVQIVDTQVVTYHNSVWFSVQHGVLNTIKLAWLNTKSIFKIVTGQMSIQNIGGPVAIAKVTGESVQYGVASFLSVLAMISISLGALNLLPIPVLDGGHLVYCAIEAIRGKAVSERTLAIGQRIGLVLLMGFMGIAIFNDVTGLFR